MNALNTDQIYLLSKQGVGLFWSSFDKYLYLLSPIDDILTVSPVKDRVSSKVYDKCVIKILNRSYLI